MGVSEIGCVSLCVWEIRCLCVSVGVCLCICMCNCICLYDFIFGVWGYVSLCTYVGCVSLCLGLCLLLCLCMCVLASVCV